MFLQTALLIPIWVPTFWWLGIQKFPLYYSIIVIPDLLLMGFMVWFIYRDSLFVMHYSFLMSEVNRAHIKEANQMVDSLIVKSRKITRNTYHGSSQRFHGWVRSRLAYFYHEHTQVTARISQVIQIFLTIVSLRKSCNNV